jgi:hypothetical protein
MPQYIILSNKEIILVSAYGALPGAVILRSYGAGMQYYA